MSAATWHLDRLGAALTKAGWCAQPRYTEEPPLLRVRHRDLPVVGESVSVTASAGDRLWFQASDGRLLAPVSKPSTAATQLIAWLSPYLGI